MVTLAIVPRANLVTSSATYAEPVTAHRLVDRYGRVGTDLRVSVTDRCNLRCTYCMPADGPGWLASDHLLTDDELVRLITIAVTQLGVTSIRFTGGEPLLRPGLPEIISVTAQLPNRPHIAMTTNGIGLDRLAEPLHHAGLDRLNISLDTLDPQTFAQLARRDRLDDALAGIDAAIATGLQPIKLNSVLMRGINDHEAPKLLQFALNRGLQLRFIEQMPLDPMGTWKRDQMVTADEILDQLQQHWRLTPVTRTHRTAPADEWLVDNGPDTVGVIASITRPFCGDCDRVRLTADGQMRPCLFGPQETDLRSALRAGASDAELATIWRDGFANKWSGHESLDGPTFNGPVLIPLRPMSAIGG